MLHAETVSPDVLDLIRSLQKDSVFKPFHLVGGTALALQIGHRTSIDIDFFSREPFDAGSITEHLEKEYEFSQHLSGKNTLKGFIGPVYIDLITHDYPYIQEPILVDGIRMLSKPDISAFKVNAITANGTRAKDFVDVYFLLKEFSFAEIVGYYRSKYNQRNDYHAVKSLIYFNDIDPASWPNLMLEKNLTLKTVQSTLYKHCQNYLKSNGISSAALR